MASYDSATLKVTEIFSKAILLPMFVYGDVLNFIHVSAKGLTKIAESTNLKGFPHTLYIQKYVHILHVHHLIARSAV